MTSTLDTSAQTVLLAVRLACDTTEAERTAVIAALSAQVDEGRDDDFCDGTGYGDPLGYTVTDDAAVRTLRTLAETVLDAGGSPDYNRARAYDLATALLALLG